MSARASWDPRNTAPRIDATEAVAPTAATAGRGATPRRTTTADTAAFTSVLVSAVIRFVPPRCSAWHAPLKTKPIGVRTVAGIDATQ